MGSVEAFPNPDTFQNADALIQKTLLAAELKPIITGFLESIEYTPPLKANTDALEHGMRTYAATSGVPYGGTKHASQCFLTGLSVAGDMYPSHALEIQVHIGIFTWLGFLIDDTNKDTATELASFQSKFHTGQPQPSLLLECFAENLRNTYKFWDPVVANFIVLSALAFINANVLETRPEYQSMVPATAAANWAYHFRNVEGLPEVFTYFMFPKVAYPDIGEYLQAVPDMGRFINMANDILSFYKEEVVNDSRNYINNRARYENKTAMSTMAQVAVETTQAYLKASAVLRGRDQYERVWRQYVMGYVAMHFKSTRYLLAEIGLDDKHMWASRDTGQGLACNVVKTGAEIAGIWMQGECVNTE